MTKYDDASWHSDGNFPADLSPSQACVHIGMYVGWIIDNNLYSEDFIEMFEEEIEDFRARRITGPAIAEQMDFGKIVNDDLSDEGEQFTEYYYKAYLKDYTRLFKNGLPSAYHVADTWDNYDKVKAMIDEKYAEWKAR